MMCTPARWAKIYLFILGFHRLAWCPKWTPASSSSRIPTRSVVLCKISTSLLRWLVSSARASQSALGSPGGPPPGPGGPCGGGAELPTRPGSIASSDPADVSTRGWMLLRSLGEPALLGEVLPEPHERAVEYL